MLPLPRLPECSLFIRVSLRAENWGESKARKGKTIAEQNGVAFRENANVLGGAELRDRGKKRV